MPITINSRILLSVASIAAAAAIAGSYDRRYRFCGVVLPLVPARQCPHMIHYMTGPVNIFGEIYLDPGQAGDIFE